jgi:hypothetical protein
VLPEGEAVGGALGLIGEGWGVHGCPLRGCTGTSVAPLGLGSF